MLKGVEVYLVQSISIDTIQNCWWVPPNFKMIIKILHSNKYGFYNNK